ncbi:MAG: DNA-3-methyladenine glycosylase [Bacteroidales bacterium]|nr:DNA-3-methyladenine glycosylase [Bacteroidales bacterium]
MATSSISNNTRKIPDSFYRNDDVVFIAKSLIGKELYTFIDGALTGGIVAETEAYAGVVDKASHAYGNRRTPRTEVMYAEGGISYVYFSYGMHYLFNVVTAVKDIPHAVLIRGIIPVRGIEIQQERRQTTLPLNMLTNGPAKLCQALGLDLRHNGISLTGNKVWIENNDRPVKNEMIRVGPRVGVGYAAEDAALPYRFILKDIRYKPVAHR